MKIAKGEIDEPMECAQPNEYPVVFKWPSQTQAAKHVYLTVCLVSRSNFAFLIKKYVGYFNQHFRVHGTVGKEKFRSSNQQMIFQPSLISIQVSIE
jgi:hypothetical protein